jgi:hypothetical protein
VLFSILNTCALSASFTEFVPEMREAALRNAGILLRVPVTRLSEANFGKLARDVELRRENSLVKRSNQCIAATAKSAQALPDGETTPVQPKARRAALAGR